MSETPSAPRALTQCIPNDLALRVQIAHLRAYDPAMAGEVCDAAEAYLTERQAHAETKREKECETQALREQRQAHAELRARIETRIKEIKIVRSVAVTNGERESELQCSMLLNDLRALIAP